MIVLNPIMKDQSSTTEVHKDNIKAEKEQSMSLIDVFNKAQEAKFKYRDLHKEQKQGEM